ncbi:hypothetical protein HID58_071229, partial [Brassica napus]
DLLRRRQDEIGQVLVLLFYDISRTWIIIALWSSLHHLSWLHEKQLL